MSMYDMLIKWDFGEHNLSRTSNIKSWYENDNESNLVLLVHEVL